MREEFLTLPLQDYILTFDDGLYSQWCFLDELSAIDTPKYFFISTKYISGGVQSLNFPCSEHAHEKARCGIYEDFMTVDQIKQVICTPGCEVGGHGHAHIRLRDIPKLTDKMRILMDDTKQMKEEFLSRFGFTPSTFCFPYNDSVDGLYPGILRRMGFTTFFGSERIPIETLLNG